MDAKFNSRKFWIFIGLFLTSTALLILGHMNIDMWAELVKWLMGLYLGSNVIQKFSPVDKLAAEHKEKKREENLEEKQHEDCSRIHQH